MVLSRPGKQGDLADGAMLVGEVGDEAVLLARRGVARGMGYPSVLAQPGS